MDAQKLTNGSKAEVLTKRSEPAPKGAVSRNAVRSEAKKVDTERRLEKKAKRRATAREGKSKTLKSEKLVCGYCGSDDLAPSFDKSGVTADAASVSSKRYADRRQRPRRRKSRRSKK